MSKDKQRVLIAGAGPVGLIAALKLSQAGIPVTILEKEYQLLDDPRAATTHPATLEMLDEIGMAKEAEEQGLVCDEFYFWDRKTGEIVAKFNHRLLADETKFPYVVQCEEFKIAKIALAKLEKFEDTTVLFSHEVTGAKQDSDKVSVDVIGVAAGQRQRQIAGDAVVHLVEVRGPCWRGTQVVGAGQVGPIDTAAICRGVRALL